VLETFSAKSHNFLINGISIARFFSHIPFQVDFPLSKWSFPINLISLQNLFAKNFICWDELNAVECLSV